MKKVAPFALLLLASPSAIAQNTTFTSYELGLAFDHPATWKIEKTKLANIFTIPLEGAVETGKLEIYTAITREEPSKWEETLRMMNGQLRREVVRQWQEEILGVPLLLTKVAYEDGSGRKTAVSGLMYSSAPRKMQFLLTAPADNFDAADFAFRQALQSLRTVRGEMPQAEDPSKPVDPAAYVRPVQTKPLKVTRIGPDKPVTREAHRGSVVADATVSGRAMKLFLPEGWSIQANETGFSATHAAVQGSVAITLHSTLDSPRALSAMFRASATSLGAFQTVQNRREVSSPFSRAGAATSSVWRTGVGTSGALQTIDATGAIGDAYWLMAYRLDGATSPEAKAALEALIEGMSLESAA